MRRLSIHVAALTPQRQIRPIGVTQSETSRPHTPASDARESARTLVAPETGAIQREVAAPSLPPAVRGTVGLLIRTEIP